jgi:hypothetical protein
MLGKMRLQAVVSQDYREVWRLIIKKWSMEPESPLGRAAGSFWFLIFDSVSCPPTQVIALVFSSTLSGPFYHLCAAPQFSVYFCFDQSMFAPFYWGLTLGSHRELKVPWFAPLKQTSVLPLWEEKGPWPCCQSLPGTEPPLDFLFCPACPNPSAPSPRTTPLICHLHLGEPEQRQSFL